uniref:C2H2-type domain-containing protein n=1 Tax=Oreochromis niloticus TaxID=8128 RepID=A0A669B5B4_ORENI
MKVSARCQTPSTCLHLCPALPPQTSPVQLKVTTTGEAAKTHSALKGQIGEPRTGSPVGRDICGDSFHSQGFLRKHAQMHCRESESMCGSHRETGGTCGICGKTFQNMETHMRSHTGLKPYRCLVCGKHFPRPGALRRHNKIHSGERPHVCNHCGKTFIESSALKTHRKSHSLEGQDGESPVHSQTKTSDTENARMLPRCKVCGESFQSKVSLRKHAKNHSAGSVCGVCGESMPPSETLTEHLQSHRDAGKICHVCGKTYQNIETHMRSHTGIKPYHCSVCGKSFPRSGALRPPVKTKVSNQ